MERERFWVKDPEPFVRLADHPPGANLETRLERLIDPATGDLRYHTPTELFFVRNNSRTVTLDAASYRLRVEGDAMRSELELTLDDVRGLPAHEMDCLLECGGDHRDLFRVVQGRPVEGDPWGMGAVGLARFKGARLADVLERAGLAAEALDLLLVGLDPESPEGGWRRPLPLAKALDGSTLLAYEMNGEPLTPDHGFPLRALVPGWVGASSIKWLGRIEVSSRRFWVRNNTRNYVLIGDAYEPEGEAPGKVATHHTLNSALALPWEAPLAAGDHLLQGYAWSPEAPVARVEWRLERADPDWQPVGPPGDWRPAELRDEPVRYAWRRFRFTWRAEPGRWLLVTRAHDQEGRHQPETVPFNEKGYLYDAPVPHRVVVG